MKFMSFELVWLLNNFDYWYLLAVTIPYKVIFRPIFGKVFRVVREFTHNMADLTLINSWLLEVLQFRKLDLPHTTVFVCVSLLTWEAFFFFLK